MKNESQSRPVALVTGSRTGLGKCIAQSLLTQGFLVVGCSRQPANWTSDGYLHVPADVSVEPQVKALMRSIDKKFSRLDVVVNNAGIASMNHSLLTPATTLDRIMAVNLRGTFLVSREAARLMQRRKFGRIVNMSSIAVPLQLEGESIYAASKAAVETLTRVMARELSPLGITVNAIGPSPVKTDLIRNVPDASIQKIIDRLAVRRHGTADDVINVIEFFIRPQSDYITGQVIYLGGV